MGYKVLIVEDDVLLQKAYASKLAKAGFSVQVAPDGEVAMEILNTFIPDIIVLDLLMPRKDGIATLDSIKKQPNLAHIPVIVASNLGQQKEVVRAKAMGAVDFILKSDLSLDDLVERINFILAES